MGSPDGASSAVRRSLGIEFRGFTWPDRLLVISTPFDFHSVIAGLTSVNYVADPDRWHFLLKIPGLWRVMFLIKENETDEQILTREFAQELMKGVVPGITHYEIAHTTLYKVHQRVAKTFRQGRAFLAGDAAHINNPLGGMGMNGGIHDAINLADKLARVVRGEAPAEELDRYERQRRPIAEEEIIQQAHRNRTRMQERDPARRRAMLDDLKRTIDDPARLKAYLLKSSMIEGLRRALTEVRLCLHIANGAVECPQIEGFDECRLQGADALHRFAVDRDERGAKRFMAPDHQIESAAQRSEIEWAAQPNRNRDVVRRRRGRIELLDQLDNTNITDVEYDAVVGMAKFIFESRGVTNDVAVYASDMGMSDDDPMLQYMQGPFVRSSLWSYMVQRNAVGLQRLGEAAMQDIQNDALYDSYCYWISMEAEYGNDPMYSMMFYWMTNYYEQSLVDGYTKSAQKYMSAALHYDAGYSAGADIQEAWVRAKITRDQWVNPQ